MPVKGRLLWLKPSRVHNVELDASVHSRNDRRHLQLAMADVAMADEVAGSSARSSVRNR